MSTRKTFLLSVLILAAPALVLAQAHGRVKGTVQDSKGNPITSAKLTVTCPDIAMFHRELKVDERGSFSLAVVDATRQYLFLVEAPGFQSVSRFEKPLIGGQTLEVEFVLASTEEVMAAAEHEALDAPGVKELREARDLVAAGKTEEARAKLAESLAAKADLYLTYLELGNLDFQEGKFAAALANAEKCLELQQLVVPCLGLAANSAQKLGDKTKHVKYMELYTFANPDDPNVLFNEAVEKLNARDDAGARPILEQVVQMDPEHVEGLYQLGMVYLRMGESARAKEMLERFLKAAPDHQDAATARQMIEYL
jgi:tetratricopeptide (TPR) repeat protein